MQASFGHASRQFGGAQPVVQQQMRDLTLKSIANEKLDLEVQYPIRLVRNNFHEGSTQL